MKISIPKSHKIKWVVALLVIPLVFLGVYLTVNITQLRSRASANDSAIKLSSDKNNVLANQQFTVTVSADLGSSNILAFDSALTYDSSVLEVLEVKVGSVFNSTSGGQGVNPVKKGENGEVNVSWAAFNNSTKQFIPNMQSFYPNGQNIVLYDVVFRVKPNISNTVANINFGSPTKNNLVTVEGNRNIGRLLSGVQITISNSGSLVTDKPLDIPVLVLEYLPPDPNNPNLLDGVETGWKGDATFGGRTLASWEQKTDEMVDAMVLVLNESTKYRGYKNPDAAQYLNFKVLERKKTYDKIPRGVRLGTGPNGQPNYRPYFASIMKGLNICDYVDNKGVKEVWMYGYHNDNTIIPDESRMSSKYGDISNSYPKEHTLPDQFKLPICSKAYTVYNFTYQPGGKDAMGNTIHNRIHQIENIIPYAEGDAYYPPTRENTSNSIFWGNFSEYIQFNPESKQVNPDGTRKGDYVSGCGNAHVPPNWTNAKQQEYGYDLNITTGYTCEDWHPDPNQAKASSFNCQRWGCSDVGFYKYWMQSIPGLNNGIEYQGKKMRNWWEAVYDFNDFIDKGRTLFE